jgi:hypothetical protein
MKKYYAITASDRSGPAYGIGTSPEAASADANEHGFATGPESDTETCIEITRGSYARIRNGDPDAVEEVPAYNPKKYAIIRARDFYGPSRVVNLVEAAPGEIMVFYSPRDARAWIAKQDAEPYYTAHNESGRPSYNVTTFNSSRFAAAYRATYGERD